MNTQTVFNSLLVCIESKSSEVVTLFVFPVDDFIDNGLWLASPLNEGQNMIYIVGNNIVLVNKGEFTFILEKSFCIYLWLGLIINFDKRGLNLPLGLWMMLSNLLLIKQSIMTDISKSSMDYILLLLKTESWICQIYRELLWSKGDKVEIVLNIKLSYHWNFEKGSKVFKCLYYTKKEFNKNKY